METCPNCAEVLKKAEEAIAMSKGYIDLLEASSSREERLIAMLNRFRELWPQVYEMVAQQLTMDQIRARLFERMGPPTGRNQENGGKL